MTSYLSSIIKRYFANYAGLPFSIWQRIGLTFFNDVSGSIVFFLSIYFVESLHLSIAMAGMIISFYGLGTILGGAIGGKLADRFNPSIVSILSLMLKALGYFALIHAKFPSLLMMCVFLVGFGTYAFKTSNNLWILNSSEDNEAAKLKAINIIYIAMNLGFGLSAAIISCFAKYGFQYLFLFSGLLLLIACVLMTMQEINTPTMMHRIKKENDLNENKLNEDGKSLRFIFPILGSVFFYGLMIAQLSATYPVYLKTTFPELGMKAVGILFVINPILIILLQAPLVNYFGRYNKITMVGVGILLYGLGMFLLPFTSLYFMAIIFCLIYTIGEMLFFSNAQLVFYQLGGESRKGRSLGLYQTTFATGMVVGPAAGGFIYHHFSGDVVWYLCGIIGVASFLFCSYMRRDLKGNA